MIATAQLTADLREDEGEKLTAYQDSLGYWTIGVGILIDGRKGGGITKEESAMLLANRIATKTVEASQRIQGFAQLDEVRQGAVLNMCFQMGVDGVLAFNNSLALIRNKQWEAAAAALKQSKWFTQTPARAGRVIEQIRTGKYRT